MFLSQPRALRNASLLIMRPRSHKSETVTVVGIGAGGHAKVLIDALRLQVGIKINIVGLTDSDRNLHGQKVLGVPVLGGDEVLLRLFRDGVRHVFIGVGGVGNNSGRRRLYELATQRGFVPFSIIHPQALVAADVTIGPGTVVLARSIIATGAMVGANVIVNTAAIIEHDCTLGAHAHVATGAAVGGGVCIEAEAHVGLGACIRQGIRIGERSVVGMGAVVVRDIPADCVVVGNPARPIRKPKR